MPANTNLILVQEPTTATVGGVEYSLDPVQTPTWFVFAAKTISAEARAAVVIDITDAATLPDGSTVTVRGQVFTADANLTESNFVSTDVGDVDQAAETLAAAINGNGTIGPLYSAQVVVLAPGTRSVLIQANTPGTAFDLTGEVSFSGTAGVTLFVGNTGANNDRGMLLQEYGYGAFAQVMLVPFILSLDSNAAARNAAKALSLRVQTLSAKYGGDNRYAFDVGRFIAPSCQVPTPTPDFGYFFHWAPFIQAYWIRYGESFNGGFQSTGPNPEDYEPSTTGGPSQQYYTGETDMRWAFPGAFSNAIVPADATEYWQLWDSTGALRGFGIRLLSEAFDYNANNVPTALKLRRRMPADISEPIGVIIWNRSASFPTLRLVSNFVMMDGTINQQIRGTTMVQLDGLYLVDVRNSRVGLDTAETATGKRVRWWETIVQMSANSTGVYVDVARGYYELDSEYNPEGYRKVLWRNKFGAFDCFEFDCLAVFTNPVDADEYQRSLVNLPGDNRYAPQAKTLATVSKRRVKLVSGWIGPKMMAFLRSLCESPQIWQDEGGTIVAYRRVEQDWELDENEQLYQLTITLEEAEVRNIIQA